MWVANSEGNTVSVVRASDGQITATYPITAPWGIAFDGSKMWVADAANGKVTAFRVSDGFRVVTVTVGNAPLSMAFDG
jgi:DNA-binding beta-propeller fold protein YncE